MVGLNPLLRQQSASDRVKSMEPFFRALLHPLFTTQATFLLLRVCALPKLNFTCRTLPSTLTSPACAAFDRLVMDAAMATLRLNEDSLPEEALTLLTLPLRHGGFGLRSMVTTAPAAFLGSLAAAARHLPDLELAATPLLQEIERALSHCQLPGLNLPSAASPSFPARLGVLPGTSSTPSPLPLRIASHARFEVLLLLPPISLACGRLEPPAGLLPPPRDLSSCCLMMISVWPPGFASASRLPLLPPTLAATFVAMISCQIISCLLSS